MPRFDPVPWTRQEAPPLSGNTSLADAERWLTGADGPEDVVIADDGSAITGTKDGRIAVYLRDQCRDLLDPPDQLSDPDPLHVAILECLQENGASFLIEIGEFVAARGIEFANRELGAALWAHHERYLCTAARSVPFGAATRSRLVGRGRRRRPLVAGQRPRAAIRKRHEARACAGTAAAGPLRHRWPQVRTA